MSKEQVQTIAEGINKMLPNILLLIAMWWFSTTTSRNVDVNKQEIILQQIERRLGKIEEKLEQSDKDMIQMLQTQIKELQEKQNAL